MTRRLLVVWTFYKLLSVRSSSRSSVYGQGGGATVIKKDPRPLNDKSKNIITVIKRFVDSLCYCC